MQIRPWVGARRTAEPMCRRPSNQHDGNMTILVDLLAVLGIATLTALAVAGLAGDPIVDLTDAR